MSIGSVLPLRVEDLPEGDGPRMEIVDGSLHVTPAAGIVHQLLVGELAAQLRTHAPVGWLVLPGGNLLRRGSTDRLLIPDVLVVEDSVLEGDAIYMDPSDALLVVEVESPSTRSVDRLLKRELYAQWRVPHYWVVDPQARTVDRLALTPQRDYAPAAGEQGWLVDVDVDAVWRRVSRSS
ncbi:Uma2 family endonuclease [Kineococcus arenarius]|uniref:Uma2 family endonuclease n=1 Tax=Kineococcus sp. SYSU DK007 TaxID=3383128 RepID=UPI003D7E7415